jgi:hypothetical protein
MNLFPVAFWRTLLRHIHQPIPWLFEYWEGEEWNGKEKVDGQKDGLYSARTWFTIFAVAQ